MSTDYEMIEPKGFLEPRRYKVSFECELCGHHWSRTFKAIPKNDPPCPNKRCIADRETAQLKAEMANLKQMLEEQKGPGHIGANNLVKAWDVTQEMVAQDYKVTNLNDRPYEGESMAPKLPQKLQDAADNFFGGNKAKGPVVGNVGRQETIRNNVMKRLSARAVAGAYKGMAVPPSAIMPGAVQGQKPLTMVRRETIRR